MHQRPLEQIMGGPWLTGRLLAEQAEEHCAHLASAQWKPNPGQMGSAPSSLPLSRKPWTASLIVSFFAYANGSYGSTSDVQWDGQLAGDDGQVVRRAWSTGLAKMGQQAGNPQTTRRHEKARTRRASTSRISALRPETPNWYRREDSNLHCVTTSGF